jgi:hypothetical protein
LLLSKCDENYSRILSTKINELAGKPIREHIYVNDICLMTTQHQGS